MEGQAINTKIKREKSTEGQATIYKIIKGKQQRKIYYITHDIINE